jgi:hypothetical protein
MNDGFEVWNVGYFIDDFHNFTCLNRIRIARKLQNTAEMHGAFVISGFSPCQCTNPS